MNKRIKELAEQAWFVFFNERDYAHENASLLGQLERFAELIRQDEREACAQVCDEASLYFEYDRASPEYSADYCAKAIRARGKE